MIISLMMIPLLITLFMKTTRFSRFIERKIILQNGIDAAILSGTQTLADGLNRISRLNEKLKRLHQLLLLVQAGSVITGQAGFVVTEKALKTRIKMLAAEQDLIKLTYPPLAVRKAFLIAKKNHAPHITLMPPFIAYAIKRDPPKDGLPSPYRIENQQTTWSVHGFAYRGAYKANAKAKLFGDNLFSTTWKGQISE